MKFKHLFSITIAAGMLTLACSKSDNDYSPDATFNTMEDSVSYALGFQNGERMTSQGFSDIDVVNFLAGFDAGLNKEESELKDANMQDLFTRFGTYLRDKVVLENKAEADAFFTENRSKPGVTETASGLQYLVVEEGSGKQATSENTVVVHYEGSLLDGTVFDSSFDGEPAEFLLGGVIPGWIEGVALMKEGATYMLYIPSKLGYGDTPRPGGAIQPGDALIEVK